MLPEITPIYESLPSIPQLSNEETLASLQALKIPSKFNEAKNCLINHNLLFFKSKTVKAKEIPEDKKEEFFSELICYVNASITPSLCDKVISNANKKSLSIKHALIYTLTNTITDCIKQYVQDNASLSVSSYASRNSKKVKAALNAINASKITYTQEELMEELSLRTGLSLKQIASAIKASSKCISLDEPLSEDNETTRGDALVAGRECNPESKFLNDSMKRDINDVLNLLSDTQREIICYSVGYNGYPKLTIGDIAKKYGHTRPWVYSNLDKAYEIMRNAKQDLRSYLIS